MGFSLFIPSPWTPHPDDDVNQGLLSSSSQDVGCFIQDDEDVGLGKNTIKFGYRGTVRTCTSRSLFGSPYSPHLLPRLIFGHPVQDGHLLQGRQRHRCVAILWMPQDELIFEEEQRVLPPGVRGNVNLVMFRVAVT